MKEISGFTPRTNEYLAKFKHKSNFLGALPKPERSPSDRGSITDRVDTIAASPVLAEEEELFPVIISADNPVQKETLMAPGSHPASKILRKVNVDNSLGGGEVVAKVSRETMEKLKSEGYKVTSNEVQYILPIYADKGDSKAKGVNDQKNKPVEFSLNATTKIDELKSTGKGIAIAVLDTGIAPHPDVKDKIIAFKDFINDQETPYDDNGHGSHVAGDAAGTGLLSEGKYKGTAPDAGLVGVKVLNSDGGAKISDIIQGIDWVIQNRDKYNIRIINMSVGVPVTGQNNEINAAVERATKAGIIVVAAAGNEGPGEGTIAAAPGNSPYALTVGAMDDKNTPQKDDDDIASFSSRGSSDGLKPDLVAPGTNIISLNVKGSEIDKQATAIKYIKELPDEKLRDLPGNLYNQFGLNPDLVPKMSAEQLRNFWDNKFGNININYVNDYYISMQGTSMATPLTAGVVADMLEVNPQLSPDQIKNILKKTADDMGKPKSAQGAGVIDPLKALEGAEKTKGELPEIFAKMKSSAMGYLISGSGGKIAVKS